MHIILEKSKQSVNALQNKVNDIEKCHNRAFVSWSDSVYWSYAKYVQICNEKATGIVCSYQEMLEACNGLFVVDTENRKALINDICQKIEDIQ